MVAGCGYHPLQVGERDAPGGGGGASPRGGPHQPHLQAHPRTLESGPLPHHQSDLQLLRPAQQVGCIACVCDGVGATLIALCRGSCVSRVHGAHQQS